MFIKYSALLAGGLAASVVSAASLPARNNGGGGSGSGNSKGDVSLIITFGDSYTDNCNTWRDTASPQNQSTYAFPKCPPAPIGRADGGYAWPEILKNGTGVEVLNFARSAATCSENLFGRTESLYNGSVINIPAVQDQIPKFQAYVGNNFKPESTVAIIFIGTNDATDASAKLLGNIGALQDYAQAEAQCVSDRVVQLAAGGVKRFIIINQAPLQRFPYYATRSGLISDFVQSNNGYQASLLPKTASSLGVSLEIFDVYSLYNTILDNPEQYFGQGAVGAQSACSTNAGTCKNPASYFLWNALHPSQATDQILASKIASTLGLSYKNPLSGQ